MTSGTVSALSAFAWFDSGYKHVQSTKAQDAWHHGRYGPAEHVFLWLVFLVTIHLALYSFRGCQAQMLGLMAVMNQKDSYVARCRAHCRHRQWYFWLFLLVTIFTLYSLLWSACSRCFASWPYGPEGQLRFETPHAVVRMPVVCNGSRVSSECKKLRMSRSCSTRQGRQHPRPGAGAPQ